MRRVNVRTNSEHFGQCRESRCKLRRSLIQYKNSKTANHCFHYGMLAEKHVFSLMGGRTFIIDVPKVDQREAAGQRHSVTDMHVHTTAFEVKLRLWKARAIG